MQVVFGRHLFPVFLLTLAVACGAPSGVAIATDHSSELVGQECYNTVYLVRHGWHTGLALQTSEISTADWPESVLFADEKFIEVGWGDKSYLRARIPHPLILVNAAFLPSRSALHVAGVRGPLRSFFKDSQIIQIKITPRQMRRLCRFIHESYRCDKTGNPQFLAPALYGSGGIYSAEGYYYIPKTCNIWTAKALAAAECPVVVPVCMIAGPLILQAKSFGDEIQKGANFLPVIYPFVNFDRPQRY